jgi:hypothetical protein
MRDSVDEILEREMVIGETLARRLRNTLGTTVPSRDVYQTVVKYCEQRGCKAHARRVVDDGGPKPLAWFRQYWFSDFLESETFPRANKSPCRGRRAARTIFSSEVSILAGVSGARGVSGRRKTSAGLRRKSSPARSVCETIEEYRSTESGP